MKPELETQLRSCVNLPSPPGVATRIIEIAQDPEIDISEVAAAVSLDPALATKVLRVANSALYAQRRRSGSLRHALLVLGLNVTLTLALSFSLVKRLKGDKSVGLDYPHFWRRALLSATAARALGEATGEVHAEELFMGGLLQDIGMVALDRAVLGLYDGTALTQRDHRALTGHERDRLGTDHAEVGAWLMKEWNLPERLGTAVARSHQFDADAAAEEDDAFNRAVAMSGLLADLYLTPRAQSGPGLEQVAGLAERLFGLDSDDLGRVFERIAALIPQMETLFETDMVADPETLSEHAREILMLRNLTTLNEVKTLRAKTELLSARASELEADTRRDALTGLFNRSFLDQCLAREFSNAGRQGWPLSVAFCDLDFFKTVNDTYGHQAGDQILQSTARVLRGNTRESDIVARYGGEEFVLVLPSTDPDAARVVCERVVGACRQTRHSIGNVSVSATISIGFATHSFETPCESPEALLQAADQALYAAKQQGRNRAVRFEQQPSKAARQRR